MTRCAVSVCVLLLGTSSLAAEGGKLKPVAGDPRHLAVRPVVLVGTMSRRPGPGAGPLSPRARVGTVRFESLRGSLSVGIAIDHSRAARREPDLLYFDFTNTGRFRKGAAIALPQVRKTRQPDHQVLFGPKVLHVRRGDKVFPATIHGILTPKRSAGEVMFAISAAAEGVCQFGSKRHAVRLQDTTGDFRFDRRNSWTSDGAALSGDIVLVDLGDGSFSGPVAKAYYGQPIFVNDAWHQVTVSASSTAVSARPVRRPISSVSIDADWWELTLLGKKRSVIVAGGREPAAVPPGTYEVCVYKQWSLPGARGLRARFLASSQRAPGKRRSAPRITVNAGRTTRLPYGAPLKPELDAKMAPGRRATFSLPTIRTTGGLEVVGITRPDGQFAAKPPPPTVAVYDARGKKVHRGTLEYG